MDGNSFGGGIYREGRIDMMRGYDRLPTAVREIMRNSIHQFATMPRLELLEKGMSADALCDYLVLRDIQLVRRDAKRDTPDQAADYVAAQRPRRRRDYLDKPPRARL